MVVSSIWPALGKLGALNFAEIFPVCAPFGAQIIKVFKGLWRGRGVFYDLFQTEQQN